MNLTPDEESTLAAVARYFAVDRLRDADVLCRRLVGRFPFNPLYHSILGDIALRLRRPEMAIGHYRAALRLEPSFAAATRGIDAATKGESWLKQNRPPDKQRYLVIKAWGAGFWSDMEHVLGGLLAAELTKRAPIVLWGESSLFLPDGVTNAWDLYFEPVSDGTVELLADPGRSFFPTKWSSGNINQDNINKWAGTDSRVSALSFFEQPHDVVVADFFDRISDLVPWIGEGGRYGGLSRISIYRAIWQKFIRLRPALYDQIDLFWHQHMTGKRWIGVHMRGTDKIDEMPDLDAINDDYPIVIRRLLDQQPDLNIFLLTDSQPILSKMQGLFGARITTTESIRGNGAQGIHFSQFARDTLAREVILDVHIAVRCEYFLGNGWSNVSRAVEFLKDWPAGTYNLLGPDARTALQIIADRSE